jgi:hypothetical protein
MLKIIGFISLYENKVYKRKINKYATRQRMKEFKAYLREKGHTNIGISYLEKV